MRELIGTTTCVIDAKRYEVKVYRDGADVIALDEPGEPSEYLRGADMIDATGIIYDRAALGKRIVRESAV